MNETFRTTVGPRGRVTIASAIQAETGINVGDDVIIRADGPGRVGVETQQAIKDRIRDGFRGSDQERAAFDAVKEIRDLRDGKGDDAAQGAAQQ